MSISETRLPRKGTTILKSRQVLIMQLSKRYNMQIIHVYMYEYIPTISSNDKDVEITYDDITKAK